MLQAITLLGLTLFLFASGAGVVDLRAQAGDPGVAAVNGNKIYFPLIAKQNIFNETFEGTPASPQPWHPAHWDITVHSRDVSTWTSLEPMKAHHGPNCEAPLDANGNLVTHDIAGSYDDSVFMCNGHVMTSIKASGYGLIYLVPPALVDFSLGEATVRFDVTTDRSSQRDFLDVWLSPWDENVAAPFDMGDVDLQGWARDAIQIGMQPANGNGTGFRPIIFKNFVDTGDFRSFTDDYNWFTGYEQLMATSPQKRTTFELKISRTHLRFGMPGGQVDVNGKPINNGQPFYWVDKNINTLSWDKAVIQFGHHSYNPEKECGVPGSRRCAANTWHWDNVSIAPAQPFTIIRSDRRYTDANSPTNVLNFPQPAPANSYLHFTGISNEKCSSCPGAASPPIELSFDDGQTWQPAKKQAVSKPMDDSPFAHAASYWTPIPAGVSRVQVRPRPQSAGNEGIIWHVKDMSIWSQTTAGVLAVADPVAARPASGELAHAANLFVCDLQSASVPAQPTGVQQVASPFGVGLFSPLWAVASARDGITRRFFP
jgi:hypothetical protein